MPIKNPLPVVVLDDVHALDNRQIMRSVVAALAALPADFTGAVVVKVRGRRSPSEASLTEPTVRGSQPPSKMCDRAF
jgi:hypothetical protein